MVIEACNFLGGLECACFALGFGLVFRGVFLLVAVVVLLLLLVFVVFAFGVGLFVFNEGKT